MLGHYRSFPSYILSSRSQYAPVDAPAAAHPGLSCVLCFPCSGNTPQSGVHDKTSKHTLAWMSLLISRTNYYRDMSSVAASLHTGELLPDSLHSCRSRGADFPPPGFDAGATIPYAKFDHFTRGLFGSPHHPAQTMISVKQQLNQNCSLAPKNLFFLNDNMFILRVGGEVTLSASS